MSMDFWKNLGGQIMALFAFLIAAATVYKVYFKKWWEKRKKIRDDKEQAKWKAFEKVLLDELAAQNKVIAQIRDEVKPNGGSSMNDVQKKMGKQLDEVVLSINSLKVGQRNFCDILEIASWESDDHGRFVYTSIGFCELMECTPIELLGNSWIGRIAYFDRDKVVKAWREAVENAASFALPFSIELDRGLYQKVTPVVIHNKDKEGKVLNSMGRLTKVDEPYKKH